MHSDPVLAHALPCIVSCVISVSDHIVRRWYLAAFNVTDRAVPVIVSPDGCCEASGREVALCEMGALIVPVCSETGQVRGAGGRRLALVPASLRMP